MCEIHRREEKRREEREKKHFHSILHDANNSSNKQWAKAHTLWHSGQEQRADWTNDFRFLGVGVGVSGSVLSCSVVLRQELISQLNA